jgi:ATP-binding cassette subfamily B protein
MNNYQYTYLSFFKQILSGNYTKYVFLIFFHFGVDYTTIFVLSCVLFFLFEEIFSIIHLFFSDYFEDSLCHKVKLLLLKKISFHPTNEFFENPEIGNLIALTQQNVQEFGRYVHNFSHFFKGLFALIPSLIAVFYFKWWLALVIIMTLTPSMYFRVKLQQKAMDIRVNFSSIFKKMNIYEECLTSDHYSKEIRLYNMQPKLLTSWNDSYTKYFNKMNRFRKSGVFISFLLSLISGIGIGVCFFYIASNAIRGNFSLGNLSFLFIIILQLRGSVSNVIFSGSEVLKANLFIAQFLKILNIKEPKINEKIFNNSKCHINDMLSLQNITFSYSGNKSVIINDVSLCIKKGESIAIVGENGAGKSTLIKLICRFYEPSNGKIFWDGNDIKTIEFDDYHSKISALFQDFAQFPLSVRENIDMRKELIEDKEIFNVLDRVELKFLLEDKLDNILSKSVEEGIELSGGQWQRLGLARILADLTSNHTLELLVFDEPTSALDPHSEHHAIELIRQMIQQKTSIVISHRLALTRFVDRILVMEKGSIVEDGSHSNLMLLKGKYYQMFTKQASYYQDNESYSQKLLVG